MCNNREKFAYPLAIVNFSIAQQSQMRIGVALHGLHSTQTIIDRQSVKAETPVLQETSLKIAISFKMRQNIGSVKNTLSLLSHSVLQASGPRWVIFARVSWCLLTPTSVPNTAQMPHISIRRSRTVD